MAKKSSKPRAKKVKKKKAYTSPTLENNIKKVPFNKRFQTYFNEHVSLPSTGTVLSLILALFVLVIAFAKMSGAEYTSITYWLEALQDMPIKIDLNKMFNTIPYINLPFALNFLEPIINFIVSIGNLLFGIVLSLVNSLQVLLYFLRKLLLLGVA